MAGPWYRKTDGWWYVTTTVDGKPKQQRLAETKREAFDIWAKMNRSPKSVTLEVLRDKFLAHIARNLTPATLDYHRRNLEKFTERYGKEAVSSLTKNSLTHWLDEYANKATWRRRVTTSVKACCNWGVDASLIDVNPFARVKAPRVGSRDQVLSDEARAAVLAKSRPEFRVFLVAMLHTGCRPREIREVQAKHFHAALQMWVFPVSEHKTGKKTGKARAITLTPCVATLSRILAKFRPNGPLFLNSKGEPWTINAVRIRMRRLRKSLNLPNGTVAYTMRHTFATNAILNGVDLKTIATLLGHGDLAMLDRHYGHVAGAEHLQAAIKKANE